MKSQNDFRENSNTVDANLEFKYYVYNSIYNSECLIAVYIDIPKAFGTVIRSVMLKKL